MIIETNPFSKVSLKAQKLTSRRPFTKEESLLIADYTRQRYPVLLVAIILEHYCLIRPAELRRLKLGAIDFSKSVIRISEDVAKMNVLRTVTITLAFWRYLKPYAEYPANYFLFGENLKPHPSKMCGEKSLATKHRRC